MHKAFHKGTRTRSHFPSHHYFKNKTSTSQFELIRAMKMRLQDFLNLLFIYRLVLALRVKRILGGIPLSSRNSGYNAVRYFVWISNGEECVIMPGTLHWEDDFRCPLETTNLLCAGSLITPTIVQTNCHCLAVFVWSSEPSEPRRAILEEHTEGRLKVHVGANQVDEFSVGMPTSKHLIHQKCSQLSYSPHYTLWDYGWTILQYSLERWEYIPSSGIDFAPLYTEKELMSIWEETLGTNAVCLILGFGGARKIYPPDEDPYEEPSSVMLHGWVTTEGWLKCKNHTDWSTSKTRRPDGLSYDVDATWGCGAPFTRELQTYAGGDSGGPTSCNNHYVGINSQIMRVPFGKFGVTKTWIPLYMALRFALSENAAEYRRSFMENVDPFAKLAKYLPLVTLRPEWRYSQDGHVATSPGISLIATELKAIRVPLFISTIIFTVGVMGK